MLAELDLGHRCESHVGEAFPPRCDDCRRLADDAAAIPRCGFIPGSECPVHRHYPLPCVACEREVVGSGGDPA
jgi:hypothetical protein